MKNALLQYFNSNCNVQKYYFIFIAWTGIAVGILIKGRIVHSIFQLPLKMYITSTLIKSLNSKKAKILKEADLIIWDGAPMANYTL